MEFSLKFNMDNDVFTYEENEVIRILKRVIFDIKHGCSGGNYIMDINGNKIGHWDIHD